MQVFSRGSLLRGPISDHPEQRNPSGALIIFTLLIKVTRIATYGQSPFRGSPPSWSFLHSPVDHYVQHFVDHLRIQRRCRFVEQHGNRIQHNARAIATRCCEHCWSCAGNLFGMCGKSHALQQFQCFFTSGALSRLSTFTCARVRFSIIDR